MGPSTSSLPTSSAQAPGSTAPTPPGSARGKPVRYKSAKSLANLASVCIGVVMLVIFLQLLWNGVATLASIGLIPSPPEGWTGVEKGENALFTLYVSTLIFGGVTVVRCQRQLIRNLQALGKSAPELDWATISWFIPIISLIAPFLTFRQIADSSKGGRRGLKPLVTSWWLSWILADVVSLVSGGIFTLTETMETWMWGASLEFGANCLQLISGVLAILLLQRLARQQDSLFQEIQP